MSGFELSEDRLIVKISTTMLEVCVYGYYIKTTVRYFSSFYSHQRPQSIQATEDESDKKDPLTMMMIVLMLMSLSYRIFVNTPAAIYYVIKEEKPSEGISDVFDLLEQYFYHIPQQMAVFINIVRWTILLLSLRQMAQRRLMITIRVLIAGLVFLALSMIVSSTIFEDLPDTSPVEDFFSCYSLLVVPALPIPCYLLLSCYLSRHYSHMLSENAEQLSS